LGKFLDIGWHMILPTGSQHYQLCWVTANHRTIRRTAPGLYPDSTRQRAARKSCNLCSCSPQCDQLITLLGFELAGLLSGAFIAEFFFNWPGLGRLILQAVLAQDLYLVMASLVMGAVMLIVGNLLLKAVDPRIRLEKILISYHSAS